MKKNIVLIGITNDIPKRVEKYELHRLIGTLFSNELNIQEKLDIIEREYNITIDKEGFLNGLIKPSGIL